MDNVTKHATKTRQAAVHHSVDLPPGRDYLSSRMSIPSILIRHLRYGNIHYKEPLKSLDKCNI